MTHIFSNSNKLFSSATTTTALRVLKLFGRKQISTSSIIPLKKFYKFLCEEENITRWTVTTDSDNVNIGDQVKVIKDEFVESTIEDTKGIIDENIFVNEKTVTIKKMLAPILSSIPPAIFGIGLNYKTHAKEVGLEPPKYPIYFMKNPQSVCGHKDDVIIPTVCQERQEVDYEVELAVVLKQDVKDIKIDDVDDNIILGYTVCNDVSARRWQGPKKGGGQWNRAKSFDTFCPLGPCLSTNIKNPNNLNIKTTVNDITLQNSNTNDLIFNVQELISFLSQGTTLAKGSIILTGTPDGVGFSRSPPLWLKQGDSVEVAVEDIGILCNRIEEE